MATEMKLPELGENITAGDVIKVLVKVGDTISANQPILEIETDKAAIEVPASAAGKVEAVHVKVGQKANVGQTILTLSSAGNGAAAKKVTDAKPLTKAASVAGSATTTSKTAPGIVSAASANKPLATAAASTPIYPTPAHIPASPSVRRRARELGVDLSRIAGSAIDGRIMISDVERTLQSPAAATRLAALQMPDFSKWGEVDKQPLSNVRRKTAENLGTSWPLVPQVTHYDKADITELEELRKRHSKALEKRGVKLTVTAILLHVCGAALKKFPQFNASIDLRHDQIIYKKYCNIGVAVDTDRGLLVPVVRNVDKKSIVELSQELAQYSEKARARKLSIEEMQGGNFTISNLGGIGGTNFSPIVNSPEAAILGVSRTQIEPVYMNNTFMPRSMLPLALSYDHRLIDGADAARFVRAIAEALQQPDKLAFN